jgi:hypothetical protein
MRADRYCTRTGSTTTRPASCRHRDRTTPPFDLLRSVPLLGGWAASGLSRLATRVSRAYVRGNITQPVVVFDAFGGR